MTPDKKIPRCKVEIYMKDTYRYTGRGSGGFEMYYSRQQCSRAAVADNRCKQHSIERGYANATLLDWNEFVKPRKSRKENR